MGFRTNIILLYSDSLRRDFSACLIIKEILRANGYKTFICSRRNFGLFIKVLKPRKIFIIGQIDMIYNERIIKEAKAGELEVHFMPAEGFAYDSEYVVMYPAKNDYDFLKSVFFWGKNSLGWFVKNRNIDDTEKLIQAGYSRLPIATAYSEVVKKDTKKVGFIGRFPAVNDLYKRSVMSFYLVEELAENRYKTMARLDAESKAINAYLDFFEKIIQQTDYTISLRPHPNENLNTYAALKKKYGERFEINNDFDVAEWMSECRAIVGLASSSYIDAYLVKTPVICLDVLLGSSKSTLQFDPGLEWMYESCYLPETIEEAMQLLVQENLPPVAKQRFVDLIENDFKGNSELVFDTVTDKIMETPRKNSPLDGLYLLGMHVFDMALATRHKIKKNTALQFDFSYYYHPLSLNLKAIAQRIRKKLRAE
ncbi:hypothetical protein GWC95_04080 [Sediminibacterium roseum]|uniref:Surface carbohydrate biosynthesis protein n=2 Tax=Sediminibacterium roseum TaxID=1978412 RepID=A0ABW9ZRK0_9BACT|nr:hypothetical protein [Sediminibacterium roseum]NCI49087.1 hypothetical protein [Sediminibacterium roseum]